MREETLALLTYARSEPYSAQGLRMAKLNPFKGLAVAGPHDEDLFCLGQPLVIDTGQCVAKAFGRSAVAPPAAAPL